MSTLIDSGSKVNAMNPAYAEKLGLFVRKTDVEDQKNKKIEAVKT